MRPGTRGRHDDRCWKGLVFGAPVLLVLGACVTIGGGQRNPAPAGAPAMPPSPFARFMETALSEEAVSLADPRTGADVRLVAGRRYLAASGRTCRRFRVVPPGRYDGLEAGLACKGPTGRWAATALIVNPGDLGTSP